MINTSTGFDHIATVGLSATSTSASVALPPTGNVLIVRNYGPNRIFIKLGGSDVTAAATDYPVEASTIDYIYRAIGDHSHIAAICEIPGETAEISINAGTGGI